MEFQVFMLGASHYNFPDKETGKTQKGLNLFCLDFDQMLKDSQMGVLPVQYKADYELLEKIKDLQLPGYVSLNLVSSTNNKGVVALAVAGIGAGTYVDLPAAIQAQVKKAVKV